jgi:hypothetical protein
MLNALAHPLPPILGGRTGLFRHQAVDVVL